MFKDPWVQMFAVVALLSGAFSAQARFAGRGAGAAAPPVAAATAAKAFASEEPPAVGPVRFQPAPAPGPAPVAAPVGGTSLSLKAKTPGRWIVDASGAADADSSRLSDVVASAAEGDVVLIRPGFYRETLVINRSITLSGSSLDRASITIDATGPLTAAIAGGSVRLENLTVTNNGGMGGTAVTVAKAALTLQNVSIRSSGGQGLRVAGGSIDADKCELLARIAFIAEADSKVRLANCQISGKEAGALVKAALGPVAASFVKTNFFESERAINLEGRAEATVDGCEFKLSGAGGGLFAFDGAQATVSDSKFMLGNASQVGLYAQKAKITATKVSIRDSAGAGVIANKSKVTLNDAVLEYNKDCGVKVDDSTISLRRSTLRHNRCGVGFQAQAQVDANDSKFSDNALGPLAAKPGVENLIKLGGTGNAGVEMNAGALAGPANAAPANAPVNPNVRQAPLQNEPVQFKNDVFGQYKRKRF